MNVLVFANKQDIKVMLCILIYNIFASFLNVLEIYFETNPFRCHFCSTPLCISS